MPISHLAFRVVILTVLTAVALAAGLSDGVAGALNWAKDGTGRVTSYLWRPLLHGGGWAEPIQPGPSPSVQPKPKPKPKSTPKPHKSPAKKS
jgi:hypothetical protein